MAWRCRDFRCDVERELSGFKLRRTASRLVSDARQVRKWIMSSETGLEYDTCERLVGWWEDVEEVPNELQVDAVRNLIIGILLLNLV